MRRVRAEPGSAETQENGCGNLVEDGEAKLASRACDRCRVWRARKVGGMVVAVATGIVWLLGWILISPAEQGAADTIQAASAPKWPVSQRAPLQTQASAGTGPAVSSGSTAPRTTEEPPPKSVQGNTTDIESILDELLTLHRRDVAAREASTIRPEDTAISFAEDALVATMADGGYAACAVRLVESVRGAGRWGGPVVVLVPTGPGSIPLPAASAAKLRELRASLVEVPPEAAGGAHVRGAGSAAQYAKVALLVDAPFRRYTAILYLDADGTVGAPLEPLIRVPMPSGRSVALPTWPSAVIKHDSFYAREIDFGALDSDAAERLRAACPDRTLVGITAWFLIKPQQLPPPPAMREQVNAALESWRAAFRFNDQGLWNVLFYNTSAFFPLCISGPRPRSPSGGGAEAVPFTPFLTESLDRLAQVINTVCGPGHARRRPMYSHGLKDCIPPEEWARKIQSNSALSERRRSDLLARA